MKIDETPFQFNASVDKIHRAHAAEFSLDDLDLSFLELLNTLPGATATETQAEENIAPAPNTKPKESQSTSATKLKGHLRLVENQRPTVAPDNDPETVQKALELLKADLTEADMQYLKQAVIPGLSILMGTVPFNSLFPAGADGQISYKGFDVSTKLQELIGEGYKTGRPIRLELDKSTAVVLKIRNGQVSAEFMSTDKNVAMMMKQELDDLRHRMALRNLPVGTLEYRDQSKGRQQPDQNDKDDER